MAQLLKRSFSMSAIARSGQLVKAPTQVHGVEGKYAAALYSAAYKQKKLEQVEKDLQTVREVYQKDAKFRDFVLDPTLRGTKKRATMQSISQKIGLAAESSNFLGLLAENGRLNKLDAVVNSYEHIMRAHRGELFVQITSAEPLSKQHEAALSDALNKMAKGGQKLTVNYTVKPSILGGLVVTIGDKYVDLSIASRIKKYKEALVSAV